MALDSSLQASNMEIITLL